MPMTVARPISGVISAITTLTGKRMSAMISSTQFSGLPGLTPTISGLPRQITISSANTTATIAGTTRSESKQRSRYAPSSSPPNPQTTFMMYMSSGRIASASRFSTNERMSTSALGARWMENRVGTRNQSVFTTSENGAFIRIVETRAVTNASTPATAMAAGRSRVM